MNFRFDRTFAVAASIAFCAAACSLPKSRVDGSGSVALFAGDPVPRLEFRAPGLAILDTRKGSTGQYVFGENQRAGFHLSASVRKQADDGDCREYYWARVQKAPGFSAEQVRRREVGELKVVEYILPEVSIPEARGVRIDQMNVIGCIRRDSADAYIHLSKIQYRPEDAAEFDAVLKSVRLVTK